MRTDCWPFNCCIIFDVLSSFKLELTLTEDVSIEFFDIYGNNNVTRRGESNDDIKFNISWKWSVIATGAYDTAWHNLHTISSKNGYIVYYAIYY